MAVLAGMQPAIRLELLDPQGRRPQCCFKRLSRNLCSTHHNRCILLDPLQHSSPRHPNLRRQNVRPQAGLQEVLVAVQQPPLRDALAAVGSVVGARVLIRFFQTLEGSGAIDQKLSRKLVHICAGPLFVMCWLLFSSAPYAPYLAALVPFLNGVRLVLAGSGVVPDRRAVAAMTRTGDPRELLRGPLYYVAVLLAVTALYWRESPVGLVITSLMCGGDGLADVVGRRLGASNPLPWNPAKSWAGSAAMLVGGFSMSMALIWMFSALGHLHVANMGATAAAVGAISLSAAAVESLPINQAIDDNLSVPGVAAVMGTVLLQVAVAVL